MFGKCSWTSANIVLEKDKQTANNQISQCIRFCIVGIRKASMELRLEGGLKSDEL